MLLIQIGTCKVNIVNIYAPTNLTEGKDFFDNLHEFFLPADHRIIDGDFNCYECDLDKFGGNFSPAKFLCDFRSVFNFTDIWRNLHPRSRDVSWFNSSFTIGSRLDKFFVSQNICLLLFPFLFFPVVFPTMILLICKSILLMIMHEAWDYGNLIILYCRTLIFVIL